MGKLIKVSMQCIVKSVHMQCSVEVFMNTRLDILL